MKRLQLRFLQLVLLVVSFVGTARGQSYTDAFLNYKVTAHYDDHTIIAYVKPAEQLSLSSDRYYYWFAGNGVHVTQGGYSGKLLNGNYQDFYMNKGLKESGVFDEGLKKGVWKNWTAEGVLKDEFSFKNGIKNGAYTKYGATGNILEKGKYRNDLLNGKQQVFAGDSVRVVFYKAGKISQRKSFFTQLRAVPRYISGLFHRKPKNEDGPKGADGNKSTAGNNGAEVSKGTGKSPDQNLKEKRKE